MRILSQDGMIDVPYNLSALSIGYGEPDHKYNIYIRSKLLDERPCIFASYSTEAKAQKAMEMFHEEYEYGKHFETICNGTMDYPLKPIYCFQFPADEDMEG